MPLLVLLLLSVPPVERSPAVAFGDLLITALLGEEEEDVDGVHEGREEGACLRGGGDFFFCVGNFGAIGLLLLVLLFLLLYAPVDRRPAVAFEVVSTIALLLLSDEDNDEEEEEDDDDDFQDGRETGIGFCVVGAHFRDGLAGGGGAAAARVSLLPL